MCSCFSKKAATSASCVSFRLKILRNVFSPTVTACRSWNSRGICDIFFNQFIKIELNTIEVIQTSNSPAPKGFSPWSVVYGAYTDCGFMTSSMYVKAMVTMIIVAMTLPLRIALLKFILMGVKLCLWPMCNCDTMPARKRVFRLRGWWFVELGRACACARPSVSSSPPLSSLLHSGAIESLRRKGETETGSPSDFHHKVPCCY